jgi:hypothetical protein
MVVCIYVSLPNCSACETFVQTWNLIKSNSNQGIEFVHIDLSGPDDSRLKYLTKEYYYFPILIITSSDLYQRFLQLNVEKPIDVFRYNVVEQDGKYYWGGRPMSIDLILEWINKNKDHLGSNK